MVHILTLSVFINYLKFKNGIEQWLQKVVSKFQLRTDPPLILLMSEQVEKVLNLNKNIYFSTLHNLFKETLSRVINYIFNLLTSVVGSYSLSFYVKV